MICYWMSLLTPTCVATVCRKFLQQHEEQRERLYEVTEAPGGWDQRRNIWMNIQLGRYSHFTDNAEHFSEMSWGKYAGGNACQDLCNNRLYYQGWYHDCDLSVILLINHYRRGIFSTQMWQWNDLVCIFYIFLLIFSLALEAYWLISDRIITLLHSMSFFSLTLLRHSKLMSRLSGGRVEVIHRTQATWRQMLE